MVEVPAIHSAKDIQQRCRGVQKGFYVSEQVSINEAKKTIHGINGVKIQDMTADIDESGKITRYKTCVKLSFGVER
jgi:flavin-binding protein dodecin